MRSFQENPVSPVSRYPRGRRRGSHPSGGSSRDLAWPQGLARSWHYEPRDRCLTCHQVGGALRARRQMVIVCGDTGTQYFSDGSGRTANIVGSSLCKNNNNNATSGSGVRHRCRDPLVKITIGRGLLQILARLATVRRLVGAASATVAETPLANAISK